MSKNPEKLKTLLKLIEKQEEEGKYFEAIELGEQALERSHKLTGQNSKRTRSILDKLADLCNMVGMILLQQQNMKLSHELLKKAERYSKKSLEKRSLTFNNLACFYKAEGKMRVSLNYLQQALVIEKQLKNRHNVADLFLNVCAVLSALKKHNEAYQASLSSVVLIQEELLELCLPILADKENCSGSKTRPANFNANCKLRKARTISVENANPNEARGLEPNNITLPTNNKLPSKNGLNTPLYNNSNLQNKLTLNDNESAATKKAKERVTILSIAYHNMAVELEHMKQFEEAMEVYQKACSMSSKLMGNDNVLVENLKEVAETATLHLTEKITKKPEKKKFVLKSKKIQSATAKPIMERNLRPKPKSEYVPRPRIVSGYDYKIKVPEQNDIPELDKDDMNCGTIDELSVSSKDDKQINGRAEDKVEPKPDNNTKKTMSVDKKKIRSFARRSGDVVRKRTSSLTDNGEKSKVRTSSNEVYSSKSNSNTTLNKLYSDNIKSKSGNRSDNNKDSTIERLPNKAVNEKRASVYNPKTIPEAPELSMSQFNDSRAPLEDQDNVPDINVLPASKKLKLDTQSMSEEINLNQSIESSKSSLDQSPRANNKRNSRTSIPSRKETTGAENPSVHNLKNTGQRTSSIFKIIKNETLEPNSLASESDSDVVVNSVKNEDVDHKSSLLSETDKVGNGNFGDMPEIAEPPKLVAAKTMQERPSKDIWEDMLSDNENLESRSVTVNSDS